MRTAYSSRTSPISAGLKPIVASLLRGTAEAVTVWEFMIMKSDSVTP